MLPPTVRLIPSQQRAVTFFCLNTYKNSVQIPYETAQLSSALTKTSMSLLQGNILWIWTASAFFSLKIKGCKYKIYIFKCYTVIRHWCKWTNHSVKLFNWIPSGGLWEACVQQPLTLIVRRFWDCIYYLAKQSTDGGGLPFENTPLSWGGLHTLSPSHLLIKKPHSRF